MKLVCFANNTGGGLVCNLLNSNYDLRPCHGPYDVTSDKSHKFCVGDTASIQTSLDVTQWEQLIKKNKNDNNWLGTHLHPSIIPDPTIFDEIIAITTTSRISKLYRWLRYYHGLLPRLDPDWKESNNIESIDKIRCLAYNIFEEFMPHSSCTNIEFQDIISGKFVREYNLNIEYFQNWKERNPWLYPIDYSSYPVLRFDEAEYEILNSIPFKYI